jgi:ABC-type multidrug transport system fused ATPase/permease subunit
MKPRMPFVRSKKKAAADPDNPPVNVIRYFHGMISKVTILAILGGVTAQFQALGLVLVVILAKTLATNREHYHVHLGPLNVRLSVSEIIALAIFTFLASAVLDTIIAWLRTKILTKWDYDRRETVVREYLEADYPVQSSERLGTLAIITGYVQRVATILGSIATLVISTIKLLTYVGFAFLVDFRAALLTMVSVGVVSILVRPIITRIKRYSRSLSTEIIDYSRDVTEATRMVRDLRVFDALGRVRNDLQVRSDKIRKLRQRSSFVSGRLSSAYDYIGPLLVLGAIAVVHHFGTIDIFKLGAIALLLLRSMSCGEAVQGAYANIVDGIPYINRLEALRTQYREAATQDGTHDLGPVETLRLDDVRYSYDGVVDAVAGISADFARGEIIGIVGPSGGGKSTLSQLLLRLRQPTGGRVLVNDVTADDYTLASWYRHVALVPQDPRLLHGTVAANISMRDRKMPRERIMAAAEAAGVHDVIEALDDGYATKIGPAFRDLSGGQIQRVGIARALARQPDILVLDEPTSALDVDSEAIIQSTLESLRGTALVIIIAHRLSTLSICDRIMVVRQGQIETIGSLPDVSEQSEFFKRALEAGTLDIQIGEAEPVLSEES